jgi:hypothetical protein
VIEPSVMNGLLAVLLVVGVLIRMTRAPRGPMQDTRQHDARVSPLTLVSAGPTKIAVARVLIDLAAMSSEQTLRAVTSRMPTPIIVPDGVDPAELVSEIEKAGGVATLTMPTV